MFWCSLQKRLRRQEFCATKFLVLKSSRPQKNPYCWWNQVFIKSLKTGFQNIGSFFHLKRSFENLYDVKIYFPFPLCALFSPSFSTCSRNSSFSLFIFPDPSFSCFHVSMKPFTFFVHFPRCSIPIWKKKKWLEIRKQPKKLKGTEFSRIFENLSECNNLIGFNLKHDYF